MSWLSSQVAWPGGGPIVPLGGRTGKRIRRVDPGWSDDFAGV